MRGKNHLSSACVSTDGEEDMELKAEDLWCDAGNIMDLPAHWPPVASFPHPWLSFHLCLSHFFVLAVACRHCFCALPFGEISEIFGGFTYLIWTFGAAIFFSLLVQRSTAAK